MLEKTEIIMTPEQALETNILPGEKLVWSSRCDPRKSPSRFFWWIIGIPLFTGCFYLYARVIFGDGVLESNTAFAAGMFGLVLGTPFLGAGGAIILYPLILSRDDRETIYAITNRRVLKVIGTRKVEAVSLDRIGHIFHHARQDGWGDLMATSYVTSDSEGKTTHKMELRGIPNVAEVHRILAEARNSKV
jgi:hypothetical protein